MMPMPEHSMPEYFRHTKLDHEAVTTRDAFRAAKTIAEFHDINDWLRPMVRAILRANLRDVGEVNTVICKIGPTYLALELKAVSRLPNSADILVSIVDHYRPTNRGGAEAAYNARRHSWFDAFGTPTRRDTAAIRDRAIHRVSMRLFHPFAKEALQSCEKPTDIVADGWINMVRGWARRVVDDGQDEGSALKVMTWLVARNQAKECAAA
ncbi:MAG: hypothetical protein QOD11_1255 [Bradyrhizobium sp.]|nr:hypothetical protein [Bradyrhizobium sp.]